MNADRSSELGPEMDWQRLLQLLDENLARQSNGDRDQDAVWSEIRTRLQQLARKAGLTDDRYGHEADDVVQGILVQLNSSELLRQVRSAQSPEGYLLAMMRNRDRDQARKHKRRERLLKLLATEPEAAEPDGAPREVATILNGMIQRLPPEERELLHLRFYEGLSIAEIARRKGAPYSRMAVRLFRLLRRLRSRLEPQRPMLVN